MALEKLITANLPQPRNGPAPPADSHFRSQVRYSCSVFENDPRRVAPPDFCPEKGAQNPVNTMALHREHFGYT